MPTTDYYRFLLNGITVMGDKHCDNFCLFLLKDFEFNFSEESVHNA